jgi:beta-N-acetylhexosaminidase
VLFPALDGERPATLSRAILTELLRGELGFRGLIVSDDLGMKAVADRYPIEELAVMAVAAGSDVLIIREPADRQRRAHEALVRAAERDSELRRRVEESAARMTAVAAACRVGPPITDPAALAARLGTVAHTTLAARFPKVDPRSPAASSPVVDA